MTVVNQNLTVSEYCPELKLPAALGLNMVNKGLVVLSVGQFLGAYFLTSRLEMYSFELRQKVSSFESVTCLLKTAKTRIYIVAF